MRRSDLVDAYLDFATAMLDHRPSRSWREKLRDEVRDEWSDLSRSERRGAVEAFETLTKLADARGGAAVEEAGEDMAKTALWLLNPTPETEESAIYRVIDREDPLWAWNEEAQVELTIGDVASLMALFDAKPGDKYFDVDKFDRQNFDLVEQVGDVVADYFWDADVEAAWLLSNFSVYTEGLEAAWDDMSRKQRRDALDIVQDGEMPKHATMKKILHSGDLAGPARKALAAIDLGPDASSGRDDGLSKGDFAKRYVKMAEAIADEKLTKSERADLRHEARDQWRDLDRDERGDAYHKLGQLKHVADAKGGPAIEAAGQDAVRFGLMSSDDADDYKALFRVLNKHDPVVAWSGEIAVTRSDVEGISAMNRALDEYWPRFDVDDYKGEQFPAFEKLVRENFPSYSEKQALKVSSLGGYAEALEKAWGDLDRDERNLALGIHRTDDYLSSELMREITNGDDFFYLRNKALLVEHLDVDLMPREKGDTGYEGGDGGGGGGDGTEDFLATQAALAEAQNGYYNREFVYNNYLTGFDTTFGSFYG